MKAYYFDESDPLGVKFDVREIPVELWDEATTYRETLVEAISDFDDEIAEKFLSGESLEEDKLKRGIRKATLSIDFVAVIPGSAFKNKGVQRLLDAIVDYLPSPLDLPAMKAQNSVGEEVELAPNDKGKAAGLVFKLWTDPFVGKLVFYRLYSGKLQRGSQIYNPRTRKMERVGRLMIMKADAREDIEVAYAGDICAIIGGQKCDHGRYPL